MKNLNVINAIANEQYAVKLDQFLKECGFEVVEHAGESNDCLRKVRTLRPDILIVDFDLSPLNGFEIARIIDEDGICSCILLLNDTQKSLIGDDFPFKHTACLVKPLNRSALLTAIDLISWSSKKIKALEGEIQELKMTLEARKEIEKAKGILMRQHGLNESEAYRRMQKQSMDRGMSMKEIAKAIILTHDL